MLRVVMIRDVGVLGMDVFALWLCEWWCVIVFRIVGVCDQCGCDCVCANADAHVCGGVVVLVIALSSLCVWRLHGSVPAHVMGCVNS